MLERSIPAEDRAAWFVHSAQFKPNGFVRVAIFEVHAKPRYLVLTDVHGRATLEVQQRYRYTYTEPVANLRHRLIVVPPDVHGDQSLAEFELHVRGTSFALAWESDAFENRVCRVTAPHVENTIEFETRFRVRRAQVAEIAHRFDPRLYFSHTMLTEPDAQLRAVASTIRRAVAEPRHRVERAFEWASGALVYKVGATHVHTTAAHAFELGRGVCQDFAHILLSVLRLLGVPARYVSGHLLGEGVPHAWVEALVDGEVIAYDPTHARRTRLDYITVAVGRDYADVAPTSGFFTGAATGRLSASKAAWPVAQAQAVA